MELPTIMQMNANATHYAVLAGMIAKTTGPVLELGVGHYSTPMIHFMCKNRYALSIETNQHWCAWFEEKFANKNHEFHCTNNVIISNWIGVSLGLPAYDVAFVDNLPSEDRRVCVEKLRTKTKFIVVHDAEPLATVYKWGNLFDTFKYKFYWDLYGNGTMVVSDFEEIGLC